ncbi:hypothetical protein [Staphylococcus succinus]|uniref:hypothetical protein n=1 Tax=Staphylococcus succinus TaxID=61015 RepID=UPI00301E3877
MRANKLTNVIEFYDVVDEGPEPGMGVFTKVFESFAEIYEPSAKDVQLGNLELDKTNITVIVRNTFPEFVPRVNQTFKVVTGMYGNESFNIKKVSPSESTFMKIVGESNGG